VLVVAMVHKANNEQHAEIISKGRKEKKTTALNAVANVISEMALVTVFNRKEKSR